MAFASSVNNIGPGNNGPHHVAPNPPPRTHSRPNQPPPPPPLPSVPPVPPTRDSSMAISKATIVSAANQTNSRVIPQPPPPTSFLVSTPSKSIGCEQQHTSTTVADGFLRDFEYLFRPLNDLPQPEPFMNKHKTYPSQKAQKHQRQSIPTQRAPP